MLPLSIGVADTALTIEHERTWRATRYTVARHGVVDFSKYPNRQHRLESHAFAAPSMRVAANSDGLVSSILPIGPAVVVQPSAIAVRAVLLLKV